MSEDARLIAITERKVPALFSVGLDKRNAQKAWLDGFDTAFRMQQDVIDTADGLTSSTEDLVAARDQQIAQLQGEVDRAEVTLGKAKLAIDAKDQQIADLDEKWAAASKFIRGVIEALGDAQPPTEALIDLPVLVLNVVGQIEALKCDLDSRDQQIASLQEQQIQIVKVKGHDGPVAAPCCISGCQYSELEAALTEARQQLDEARLMSAPNAAAICAALKGECEKQHSLRLDAETELAEARQSIASLRQLLECPTNGTHYCPNCDRSLNQSAVLSASRAPQGEKV